jgi:hypothetical protein
MQQFDAFCKAELDENVLALDVTKFTKSGPHCLHAGRITSSGAKSQVADARDLRRLLRPRDEWPRSRRAAEQGDELAALHSITSSALAWSVSGTVRPSDFAVLRLMASSNFVGC